MKMKNVAAIVVITMFVTASLGFISRQASQQEVDSCVEIGDYSGCSGCNVGSGGQCEWCHDPLDETGLGVIIGGQIKEPKCLPKGHCSDALGGGRVSSRPTLCPANPRHESRQKGSNMIVSYSTVFSQGHFPRFCRLGFDINTKADLARNNESFSYLTDRSVARGLTKCSFINNNVQFGVSISIGVIADRCFARHEWPFTPRMKACLEAYQAFQCTSSCPEYGKAIHGFCQSSCDALLAICEPFMGNPECPFTSLTQTLGASCVPDDIIRCDNTVRIPAAESWKVEYGVYKKYNLPIDCTWGAWSAYGECDLAPGDQCNVANPGVRVRTRQIATDAQFEGRCPGDTTDSLTCPFSDRASCQDCIFEWNAWSPCSYPCTSTQARNRTFTVLKTPGVFGTPCPAPGTLQTGSCCLGFTTRFHQFDFPFNTDPGFGALAGLHTDNANSYTVAYFDNQIGATGFQYEKNVINFRHTGYDASSFAVSPSTRWYYMAGDRPIISPTSIFYADLHVTTPGTYTFHSLFFLAQRFTIQDGSGTEVCRMQGAGGSPPIFCVVTLANGPYRITLLTYSYYHQEIFYYMVAPGNRATTWLESAASLISKGFVLLGSESAALGLHVAKTTRPLPTMNFIHRLPTFAPTRSAGAYTVVKRTIGFGTQSIERSQKMMATQTSATCISTKVLNALDLGGGGLFGFANSFTPPAACGAVTDNDWAVDISGVIEIPNTGPYSFCVFSPFATYVFELEPDAWTPAIAPKGIWRLGVDTPVSSISCKVFNMVAGERQFRFHFNSWRGLAEANYEVLAAEGTSTTVSASHFVIGASGGLRMFTTP